MSLVLGMGVNGGVKFGWVGWRCVTFSILNSPVPSVQYPVFRIPTRRLKDDTREGDGRGEEGEGEGRGKGRDIKKSTFRSSVAHRWVLAIEDEPPLFGCSLIETLLCPSCPRCDDLKFSPNEHGAYVLQSRSAMSIAKAFPPYCHVP